MEATQQQPTLHPSLGYRIRKLRRRLRLSGAEFAQAVSTTKQSVSLIENEKRMPSATLLLRIASVYGVDARYLHGQIDEIRFVERNAMVERRGTELPATDSARHSLLVQLVSLALTSSTDQLVSMVELLRQQKGSA